MRLRVLLMLLFLAYIPTLYAGPKEEATAQKKRGDNLMEEGNYEEALKAFEEAKRLTPDASIELSLAGALLKLRRFEEAKASYQTYLDAGKASKPNQKKIKDAIANIESTLKTSVACQSEPLGAKVFLNSRVDGYIGETPISFNVPPGEHRLFFEREGFQPKTERLIVAEGDKASLKTSLLALPFSLFVESTPNAEIFIDGASRGLTPQTLEVPTGKHELVISREGYEPIKESVEGSLGQKVTISKTLSAKPSTLKFEFSPARAEIRIEGQDEVFQSNSSTNLPSGEYVVVAKAIGFAEQTSKLSLRPGQAEVISISLQPNAGTLQVNTRSDAKITASTTQSIPANQLSALPPATYTLQIEAPNHLPIQQEVSIALGVKTTIDAKLKETPRLSAKSLLRIGAGSVGASLAFGGIAIATRKQFLASDKSIEFNENDATQCRGAGRAPLSICVPQILSTTTFVVAITSTALGLIYKKRLKPDVTISTQKEAP